jgi:hypothetical protein
MTTRNTILLEFNLVLKDSGVTTKYELDDETILLDSGLDSLGFAILVARLEERLGYDPFVLMKEPVYPTTFAEFVAIYDQNRPSQ